MSKKEIENNFIIKNNFCIFSRITKKKGVIDAINTIIKINELKEYEKRTLDIYGPIENDLI